MVVVLLVALLHLSQNCFADELLTDMHYYGRFISVGNQHIHFSVNDESSPREFPIQRRTQLKFSNKYEGPVTVEANNKRDDSSIDFDIGESGVLTIQDIAIPAPSGSRKEIPIVKATAKDGQLILFDMFGKSPMAEGQPILVTGKKPTVVVGANRKSIPANSAFVLSLTGDKEARKVSFRRARRDRLFFQDDRTQDASILSGDRKAIEVQLGKSRSPSKIETKTIKMIIFDNL